MYVYNNIYTDLGWMNLFLNLKIDLLVISIIYLLISIVFDLFQSDDLTNTVLLIGISLIYYTFFEFFIGKTIGKLFTKTQVLSENGLKPNFTQCLQRSLSRLLLIEVFSFIPEYPIGWHDKWSKTRVIKD